MNNWVSSSQKKDKIISFSVLNVGYAKRQIKTKNSPLKIHGGWYRTFLKRDNFIIRKKTTSKTKPDSNQKEIDKFVEHVKQILSSGQLYFFNIFNIHLGIYDPKFVINFDETWVYKDQIRKSTIYYKWTQHVMYRSIGKDKNGIKIASVIFIEGDKLDIIITENYLGLE